MHSRVQIIEMCVQWIACLSVVTSARLCRENACSPPRTYCMMYVASASIGERLRTLPVQFYRPSKIFLGHPFRRNHFHGVFPNE